MSFALLLLAAQTLPAAEPAQPTRWSILAPACAADSAKGDDILVCGRVAPSPRLPLPDERGPPDRPMPSNRDKTGAGALAAFAPPCGLDCTGVNLMAVGVGVVRGIGKLIDPDSCCEEPGEATSAGALVRDIGRAVKRKPSKAERAKRIPIEL